MLGFKPDKRIWERVNQAILGEGAGPTIVTLISGLCAIIVSSGVCTTEEEARVHLAAMLLSPDNGPVGSLVPQL